METLVTHLPTNSQPTALLVHADPGARSGLVAAWLSNTLSGKSFDVGADDHPWDHPGFNKIHYLKDVKELTDFNGIKIRIQPTYKKLDLHCLLFLRKNVHILMPNFTKDEYCLETFTKLWRFVVECFEQDSALDLNMYDYVINFESTFVTEYMVNLYKQINNREPTPEQINALVATNELSNISIPKNHSTSILKLCMDKEKQLLLKEEHRFWSIVDVYNTTPIDKLYDTVLEKTRPENYGILLT